MAIILLVDNNNLKLKFDDVSKKLIFTDVKGYSYNVSFQEKNIIKTSTPNLTSTINNSTISNLANQIDVLTQKVNNLNCNTSNSNCNEKTTNNSNIKTNLLGIKVDYIVESKTALDAITDMVENSIGLIEQELDLYKYNDCNWVYIGNIKGEKGLEGPSGPQGLGLRIDYIFKNEIDFNNYSPSLIDGNIILYSDTGQIYKYIANTKINSYIGKLDLNISNVKKDVLYGANMYAVDMEYENISIDQLRIIEFDSSISNDMYHIINKLENKTVKLNSGRYKIKYNICWETTGNNSAINKYLKSGVLFFVYNCSKLIKQSVLFDKGYPLTNSSSHEFIINSNDDIVLTFIFKIGNPPSNVCVDLYGEGCYLEIEKI